jgi:hypothetical protein
MFLSYTPFLIHVFKSMCPVPDIAWHGASSENFGFQRISTSPIVYRGVRLLNWPLKNTISVNQKTEIVSVLA